MGSWIERQKNILNFTLSALWRHKGKNAALAVVYTFTVFALASVLFFSQAIRREAAAVLQEGPEMFVQRMVAGRHDLIPTAYMAAISKIRGVNSVRERLWGYYYDPVAGANYTLMVPPEMDLQSPGIVIGEGVARTRLTMEGDDLEFRTYDGRIANLTVRRRLPAGSELVSADLVLLSAEDFRRVAGTAPGYATDLALQVKNRRELATIAQKIVELLPDTRVILREEILRTYDAIFSWRGGLLMVVFAGALAAFFILAWDKASGLSSEERKEIGILKAIGWETSDVLILKFWEGAVISLTSFLAGILGAYFHVFFASGVLLEPVLKGWSVLYPRFRLTPFLDPYQVGVLFLLAVVPYTVATIIPSWRASTTDPDAVIRT